MKRIAVLLIIGTAFISACTSTKWVRTQVAKEYDFIVALEQHYEKEGIVLQKFEQPKDIDLADLKKLMGDLTYLEKAGLIGKSKQIAVFQPDEIDRLAPVLANTLAKADASQRVRFLSFNQGQGLVFSQSQKTEGVIFVEAGGRLNIVFTFINAKRLPSESSAFNSSLSEVDPLKIDTSETLLSAAAAYLEAHQLESGQPAPMWVVADLKKLKEAVSSQPVSIIKATETISPAGAPKTGTMETPAETTVTAPTAKPVPTQASTPTQVPAPTPVETRQQEIKTKLKYLKELLDEGLISEKDYNAKKMQLLDKID